MAISLSARFEKFWAAFYAVRMIRAAYRLAEILLWTFACYFVSRVGFKKSAGRAWMRRMPMLLGLRIKVRGQTPASPFFLVNNHISWLDFFAMNTICDSRTVVMAEMRCIPLAGRIIDGLSPIYVQRTRSDTTRVIKEMMKALDRGDNLMMCPEGTVTPGLRVRRFHAGLLESAVQCRRPIHWAVINYDTPAGCPPPSQVVLFGPDPYYAPTITPEETEAWGPRKSFLRHAAGVLALPYTEANMTFGAEPIYDENRINLANRLHASVSEHFTPLV